MTRVRLDRVPLPLVGDVLLAAVFTLAAELDVWVRHTVSGPRLTNAVLLGFVAPPLVVRRRWPCSAVLVTAAAIALQAILVGKPPSGFLYWPILILSYSLGAQAPPSTRAWAALAVLVASYAFVTVVWTSSGSLNVTAIPWMLAAVLPWLLGRYMRRRRGRAAAVAEGERLERQRERQRLEALEQERARMARELHDILAHSVSLMGVQAGAAEEVLGARSGAGRPVLRSIQQTSRDSVAELRRLLGMLRAQELGRSGRRSRDSTSSARSSRGCEKRVCRSSCASRATRTRSPAGLELTAYRVVQEGAHERAQARATLAGRDRVRYGNGTPRRLGRKRRRHDRRQWERTRA